MTSGATVKWLCAANLLGLILIFAGTAYADGFGLPDYAAFGTQSVTINDGLDENTTCITGNVGTGGTGSGALSLDKCLVSGNVNVTTASVLSLGSHGAYSGSLVTGSLSGVGTTMSTVSSNLHALAQDLMLASLINTSRTFTNASISGGTYVIDITGNASSTDGSNSVWTFSAANPNDKFVVNIDGNLQAAGLTISLSGFTDADQLIFNVAGCDERVNKSDSVWFGTILAPNCNIRVDNPYPFTGEVFGKTVTVDSAATLTAPPPPTPPTSVPEPSSLLLLGSGLVGLGFWGRKWLVDFKG